MISILQSYRIDTSVEIKVLYVRLSPISFPVPMPNIILQLSIMSLGILCINIVFYDTVRYYSAIMIMLDFGNFDYKM